MYYYIQVFATVIFFAFGIYNLFKEHKPPAIPKNTYDYFDFGKGLLVASMNVLIIPFWLFIVIWLRNYDMIFNTQINIIVFSLGALVVFISYAELRYLILARIGKIVKYTNTIDLIAFLIALYNFHSHCAISCMRNRLNRRPYLHNASTDFSKTNKCFVDYRFNAIMILIS